MKKIFLGVLFILLIVISISFYWKNKEKLSPIIPAALSEVPKAIEPLNPLSVETMRKGSYPGSEITIEKTLSDGSNYKQYLTTYQSEGLKIFALLTVPKGTKPENGWPIIVFNHGYIPPKEYRTTERYVAYVGALARSGYIVFKPDYRGHGDSEGQPEGAYFSPAYTIDDLNAIASITQYPDANPDKLGVWGHSMGGNITLRDLVTKPSQVKAAVIWGGVVASYDSIINHWHKPSSTPRPGQTEAQRNARAILLEKFGAPLTNSPFWQVTDPTNFVKDIQAPIQIHQGLADAEVPPEFADEFYQKLQSAGKTSELFTYPGADHNISAPSFNIAMQRTIAFFDKYLK